LPPARTDGPRRRAAHCRDEGAPVCSTEHGISYPIPVSQNRRDLEPNRGAQERERARRRGVLMRDAYWALIIAVIVVGGAKLFGVL
jgi:hypothetical protein